MGVGVLKIAGAGRAGDGETVGVGRDGGEDARSDAAGGAADCPGVRAQRDDGEGEVSGMGDVVGHSGLGRSTEACQTFPTIAIRWWKWSDCATVALHHPVYLSYICSSSG